MLVNSYNESVPGQYFSMRCQIMLSLAQIWQKISWTLRIGNRDLGKKISQRGGDNKFIQKQVFSKVCKRHLLSFVDAQILAKNFKAQFFWKIRTEERCNRRTCLLLKVHPPKYRETKKELIYCVNWVLLYLLFLKF